jgi:outer membrane protein assembly factor BamB
MADSRKLLFCVLILCAATTVTVIAADQPRWGQKYSRNMVSDETGLVDTFDIKTGANIKWTARLGSETHATPIVSGGKVFLGANNGTPRDPRHKGDRGTLYCLDEKDGSLCWQLVVPKLTAVPFDPYLDWPNGGICSPVTVEGDRVYAMSNRGEVMCLDINGLTDGNDGPFKDEARHMTPQKQDPIELGPLDADIIWLFDVHAQVKTYPHDAAHSSYLIDGDFIYLNTNNGVDNTHRANRAPDAPSLIVLDKKTGALLAKDDEKMGRLVYHCTWSSPAMGVVNGKKLIFFGGGDGVVYAFEALKAAPPKGKVKTLKRVWKFDCDPDAPKKDIHSWKSNRTEGPTNIKSMIVFQNNRVYVTAGGDIWWGKRQSWLKCIDASLTGDITKTGEIYSYEMPTHCCATPAVYKGLVFVADCAGYVHCVNDKTGKAHWTHDTGGEIWASPLVADGKVYIGNRRRGFFVFDASDQKNIVSSIKVDSNINSTATAANKTIYVTTMRYLYAIGE